jgi:REP element-mobilizing transposase RayT
MASSFKARPNRKSPRWKNWDYANQGAYFITTITKNRQPFFGRIEFGEMILNKVGQIAHACWNELPNHFINIELGEFIVMPDHFHGIISIHSSDTIDKPIFMQSNVSGYDKHSTDPTLTPAQKRFRNQGKNTVSAMVGSFKSAVTRLVRPQNQNFGWQSRFHDHVIRDADEYYKISRYIKNNPRKWGDNKYNNK